MAKIYSKKFVENQKSKLENEKKKILLQTNELKKEDPFSDPDHASDNAAVDTDVREQVGHDTIEAEIKDMNKRLINIDLALKKISKKSYGICDKCNELIPQARLELVPEALFCIECERKIRK